MTFKERTAAAKILDDKIEEFLTALENNPNAEDPDRELLLKTFTENQLSALWKRLEQARGKEPETIEQAWQSLRKLPRKQAEAQRAVTLLKFLKDKENPDDGDKKLWVDHIITCQEKITNKHTMQVINRPLYKGELEQIHGKAEAAAHIRQGKWVAKTDKDGDTVYVKRSAVEILEKESEQTVSGTRYHEQT